MFRVIHDNRKRYSFRILQYNTAFLIPTVAWKVLNKPCSAQKKIQSRKMVVLHKVLRKSAVVPITGPSDIVGAIVPKPLLLLIHPKLLGLSNLRMSKN
jgi:hypothetical protein